MIIAVSLDSIADLSKEVSFRLQSSGISADEVSHKWLRQQYEDPVFFLNAIAYEDAFYAINKWFYAGHDIEIISYRSKKHLDITERWLSEWGIMYNNIHLGIMHYRVNVATLIQPSIMIENNRYDANLIASNGIRTYLVKRIDTKTDSLVNNVQLVENLYVVNNYIESSERKRSNKYVGR